MLGGLDVRRPTLEFFGFDRLGEFGLFVSECPRVFGLLGLHFCQLAGRCCGLLGHLISVGVSGWGLTFIPGCLVGCSGVRRHQGVRCVGICLGNMLDLVCCHVLVWHRWVGFSMCAPLGCFPCRFKPPVVFGVGGFACCGNVLGLVCRELWFFCGRLGDFLCDGGGSACGVVFWCGWLLLLTTVCKIARFGV